MRALTPGRRELAAALNELYRLFGSLTMASVARRVDVSEAAVSHWLHGRRVPGEETLVRLYAEAVKVAPSYAAGAGQAAPFGLDHLLDLRRRADCNSSACLDRRAAEVVASAAGAASVAEGDRRNGGCDSGYGEGDRRNSAQVAAVGKPPPTQLAGALALLEAGNQSEAFRFLSCVGTCLPVAELEPLARALVERGCENAARILLEGVAARRSADVIEIALIALRPGVRMRT